MRGKRAEKRKLIPDPIYNSRVLTRFVNRLMRDGKKTVAQKIVYDALEDIKKQDKNPLEVFETAMRNVAPKMEVHPRRVGGASYQIPTEVKGDRREALAIRWIIASAKSRSSSEYKSMKAKLAAEFSDAAAGTGAAIKKRDDTHRMAEANKAFAHFRW
ncbi:MAG: 30S ribosomal protein S7 [Candidatus Woykebacteria bacterium]